MESASKTVLWATAQQARSGARASSNPDLALSTAALDAAVATFLAAAKQADLRACRDASGTTPLHAACEHGAADLIPRLVQLGCDVDARNEQLKTPAMMAAAGGHLACLQALLAAAPVHRKAAFFNDHKKNAWTALFYAAKGGYIDCVQYLLSHGAVVDDVNREGSTALYVAAREGQADVVRLLAEAGADVNHKTNIGRTPLIAATSAGQGKVVEALIVLGAHLLDADSSGSSAWHEAATAGSCDCVDALSTAADRQGCLPQAIQLVDATGRSALHFAALAGNASICADLVSRGWRVDAIDGRGCTALYYACAKGLDEVVMALLGHTCKASPYGTVGGGGEAAAAGAAGGSAVAGSSNAMRSPICIASTWGNTKCVAMLLFAAASSAAGRECLPLQLAMDLRSDSSGGDVNDEPAYPTLIDAVAEACSNDGPVRSNLQRLLQERMRPDAGSSNPIAAPATSLELAKASDTIALLAAVRDTCGLQEPAQESS